MKFITLLFLLPLSTFADTESMKQMPILTPKQIITVKGNEDFDSQKGFGDQEPQIKMKNLMMVGGSGMEEMAMDSAVTVAQNEKPMSHVHTTAPSVYTYSIKPTSAYKVGNNLVEITINDENSKPVGKLPLKAEVYMTSMDMGTEHPIVKEKSIGVYQVKAAFSMKGPWAIKLIFPDTTTKEFDITVK